MKKIITTIFTLITFCCINSEAVTIHEFKTSEGLTKLLISADTVNYYFLKPKKYAYKNSEGKIAFEIECEYAGDFINGYAKIKKDGKFGFINTKGEFVIKAQYKTVSDLSEGYIVVGDSTERLNKIIDINNKTIATFNQSIQLSIKINGEGTESGLVLMTEDVYSYKFSEGLINIENKFYDVTGKFKFSIPGNSHDCKNSMILFSVELSESGGEKFGFCDNTGKPIIYPQYDAAEDFNTDRAIVGKKGTSLKFFEINKTGKILKFVTQK